MASCLNSCTDGCTDTLIAMSAISNRFKNRAAFIYVTNMIALLLGTVSASSILLSERRKHHAL
jgi:hypothetical protein